MNTSPSSPSLARIIMIGLLAASAGLARGQQPGATGVPGTLHTQDRRMEGNIRWLPVAGEYEITARSGVAMRFGADRVVRVDVAEPRNLREGIDAVRRNQLDRGIPILERIAQDYLMLQWDVPATRWLAEAHLRQDDAAAAIQACERLIRHRSELGYASDIAYVYWRALRQTGRRDRLERLLEQAMSTGSRELIARALIMRGDLLRDRGETRNALKDGYLRVVLMLSGERDVMPEALYRAMQSFEELGEVSYAERMRSQLLSEFANSEYARRVQAGG